MGEERDRRMDEWEKRDKRVGGRKRRQKVAWARLAGWESRTVMYAFKEKLSFENVKKGNAYCSQC